MRHLAQPFLLVLAIMLGFHGESHAATPRHYLPFSLSYSWPSGGLADSTGANGALGFSLGYQFALDKNFRLGFRGTWSRMTLGQVDSTDLSDYGLTHIGVMIGLRYRLIKHDISPYIEGEGGMGYMFADQVVANMPRKIEGLSQVKMSVAGSFGILIPINDKIEGDVGGRYCATFIEQGFNTMSAHVGLVWALK